MLRKRTISSFFFKSHKPIEPYHEIIESTDIRDILTLKHCTLGTWVILDLDNTVIEPEDHHEELGSDQWFVQFIQYASKVKTDQQEAVSLVITIYHAVQHHVNLRVVQPEVARIIQILQDLHIPVLALTARSAKIAKPTEKQLQRNNIHFLHQWSKRKDNLEIDSKSTDHFPIYRNGIIYCDGYSKEKCLEAFFDSLDFYPDNVLMVDDKDKYLKAVQQMTTSHGSNFVGLHYRFLDEKVKNHNFAAAQRKLLEIHEQLPDQAKEAMAKLGI